MGAPSGKGGVPFLMQPRALTWARPKRALDVRVVFGVKTALPSSKEMFPWTKRSTGFSL